MINAKYHKMALFALALFFVSLMQIKRVLKLQSSELRVVKNDVKLQLATIG